MTYVFSTDGTTIDRQRSTLPRHLHRDLTTGEWSTPTPGDSERFGWHPVTELAQPDADHVRSVAHNGSEFVEVWTFDPTTAAANLDNADRDNDRAALRDDLDVLQGIIDGTASAPVKNLARVLRRLIRSERLDQ